MPESALQALMRRLSDLGARRLLVKWLAENDNSKNQIYLGPGLGALNLLPAAEAQPSAGNPAILYAGLDLLWLAPDDAAPSPAPHAKLIVYPQYPEVRLSGFLLGSPHAPAPVLAGRGVGRVLVLGITPAGRIYGAAFTAHDPVARELAQFDFTEHQGVFAVAPISEGEALEVSTRELLLARLHEIASVGWVRSKRLSAAGTVLPCPNPNCGGYTLEAELGITPNGRADPDYLGWEVKQHDVGSLAAPKYGALTLLTPEPTDGYYATAGVRAFIRRFGYLDTKGRPDRLNFGGTYRFGQPVVTPPRTETLTLGLIGYDASAGRITDAAGGIALTTPDGEIAAKWPFATLLVHWQRKHAQAVFVPSERREAAGNREYRYGAEVGLGEGTEFARLLGAVAARDVYYDPGLKLENASTPTAREKRRSQFRVRSDRVASLYASYSKVSVA